VVHNTKDLQRTFDKNVTMWTLTAAAAMHWLNCYGVLDFHLHDVIPTPQFQFGGVIGNKETVLVFRRTD